MLDFIRIVADDRQIVFESRHFAKGHSSSNASLDRARLVMTEVDVVFVVNQSEQLHQFRFGKPRMWTFDHVVVPRDPDELIGNRLGR